jgi:hypothetical protein
MTKRKMIGVMLMASSIIDKNSPQRSMDSRRQTRTKHASRTLQRLHLSSCYFLKRSKSDISENVKFPWVYLERSSDDPRNAKLFSASNPCPEVLRDHANQRAEHCESNGEARN